MSDHSKLPNERDQPHPETTAVHREKGACSRKTEKPNIFVFTPSKLKELGFVTKVEGGKTLLVKPQDSPSTSKHSTIVEVERRKSCDSEPVNTSPKSAPTMAAAETPGRRRIIQGFRHHWFESLRKDGFIKCPLRQCTFISLRHEDMAMHYTICNGRANNTEFVCPSCKCCLKTKDDLELHRSRTHCDSTIELKILGSSQARPDPPPATPPATPLSDAQLIVRKRGYSKVHKQAWTIAIASNGYVNCIFQNCIFMALSVEEMIEHYRCCNSKGLDNLFVCPQCNGGVQTREKLDSHIRISHGGRGRAFKTSSSSKLPHCQEHQGPSTSGLKVLATKTTKEPWHAFRGMPSTKVEHHQPTCSPKNAGPTRRPCYAPDEAGGRLPRIRPLPLGDAGTHIAQPKSSPMPTSTGQVCTFLKRRPDQSAVELFPRKVCPFLIKGPLSRKRKSPDHNTDNNTEERKRSRIDGKAGKTPPHCLDVSIEVEPGSTTEQPCNQDDNPWSTSTAAPHGGAGVDYYISESSREVANQEEIADEPEYIISDMIVDAEEVTSNVGTVEIKYFHNVAAESQKKVLEKAASLRHIIIENKDHVLIKSEMKIVAADVSKDKNFIPTNDGNDCSRLTENIKLRQMPLQIADNFVSDPLMSDLVEGPDNVQSNILKSHSHPELGEDHVPYENLPFQGKKEFDAAAEKERKYQEPHEVVPLDDTNACEFHPTVVSLEQVGRIGSHSEAEGFTRVGALENSSVEAVRDRKLETIQSTCKEVVQDCESHFVPSSCKFDSVNINSEKAADLELRESQDVGEVQDKHVSSGELQGLAFDTVLLAEEVLPSVRTLGAVDATNQALCSILDKPTMGQSLDAAEINSGCKLPLNEIQQEHDERSNGFAGQITADNEGLGKGHIESSGKHDADKRYECREAVLKSSGAGNNDMGVLQSPVSESLELSSSNNVLTHGSESTALIIDGSLLEKTVSLSDLKIEDMVSDLPSSSQPASTFPETDPPFEPPSRFFVDPVVLVTEPNSTIGSQSELLSVNCNDNAESLVEITTGKMGPCDLVELAMDPANKALLKSVANQVQSSLTLSRPSQPQGEITINEMTNVPSHPLNNCCKNKQQQEGGNLVSETRFPKLDDAVVEGNEKSVFEEGKNVQCNDEKVASANASAGNLDTLESAAASFRVPSPSEEWCAGDPATNLPMQIDSAEDSKLSLVCTTSEGFEKGRLGDIQMPLTTNSSINNPKKTKSLVPEISELKPSKIRRTSKNTTEAGEPSTEQLKVGPDREDIQKPPSIQSIKRLELQNEESPTGSCDDTSNIVASCGSVVGGSSPKSVDVLNPRNRTTDVIAVENVPSASHCKENLSGCNEEVLTNVPQKVLKKRGRPKKTQAVAHDLPPNTLSDTRPPATINVKADELNTSVTGGTAEPSRRRGRPRKDRTDFVCSTRKSIKSKSRVSLSANNKSQAATPPERQGLEKEPVPETSEEIDLNLLQVPSSSTSPNLVSTTEPEHPTVKPAKKRGKRIETKISATSTAAKGDDSSPTLPAKRGRPRKVVTSAAKSAESDVSVTELGDAARLAPGDSLEAPPNRGGIKRKLMAGSSEDSPQGNEVQGGAQEERDDAAKSMDIEPNEHSALKTDVPTPQKNTSGRKKGRWAKKTDSQHTQASVSSATAETASPALLAQIVSSPCPSEKSSRGRKSAIALFYEKMEQARGKVSQFEQVKCGKCNLDVTRKQFTGHNKLKHAGLGWISGEIPVDVNNLEQVRYCLSKTFVKRGRMEITCEVCKVSKRSIEGFVAHLELYCQKSSAEQDAMRVSCPICARIMLPTSLKVHMGVSHKSGLPEPPELPPEPRLLGKRAAAAKAAELIASLKSDEVEPAEDADHAKAILNRELMMLYKKTGGPRKVNGLVNARFKTELKAHGTLTCRNVGCDFASPDLEAMHMHYEMCAKIPPLTFRCRRCGFKCHKEDAMMAHVASAPGHGKKEKAEEPSYSDVPDNGSASDPDDGEVLRTPGQGRRSKLFHLNKNASLASRVKFLSREISAKVMGDNMYLPTSKWWLDFQTENFRGLLFPTLLTRTEDLVLLEAAQAAIYLPVEQESIPLSTLLIDGKSSQDPKTEPSLAWQRLGLFEAIIVDGIPVMFAGGPIWALAWCPIPTPLLLESGPEVSQFLAVACHRGMDDVYTVAAGRQAFGAIQIWDFGPLDHANACRVPSMALALAHNFGAVWHLEWCPSGCYDSEPVDGALRRMGLLAAACSDGRVHIFAVPFPQEVAASGSKWPVVSLAPVLSLVCGGARPSLLAHDAWMCNRLSWFKNSGHTVVAGAFSNGMACVWNLDATSPLLVRQCGRTRVVFAHKTFQAHVGSITALSLFPYFEGRYLMTGGVDRMTKIWDLQQTAAPISSSSKGVVTDGVWLSHWVTTVTAYDDGFGIHHGNTMLHSVRNFGFNPCPILPQNSPVWSVSGSEWSNAIAQGTAAGELCVIFPHQLFIGADVEKSMKFKRMVISFVDLVESGLGSRQETDAPTPRSSTVLTPPLGPAGSEGVKNTPSVASSSKPGSEPNSESVFDESRNVSAESESEDERCDSGSRAVAHFKDKEFMSGKYDDIAHRFNLALCHYPLDDFTTFPNKGRDSMRMSELMGVVPTEMYPISSINRVSWNPNCTSHLWLASGYHCGLVRVPCIRGMQNALFARELFSGHPKMALTKDNERPNSTLL